jgi:hypothetical protein
VTEDILPVSGSIHVASWGGRSEPMPSPTVRPIVRELITVN